MYGTEYTWKDIGLTLASITFIFLMIVAVASFIAAPVEADNKVQAYGQTYKINDRLIVHNVTINGVMCNISDTRGSNWRPAPITCDWGNKK